MPQLRLYRSWGIRLTALSFFLFSATSAHSAYSPYKSPSNHPRFIHAPASLHPFPSTNNCNASWFGCTLSLNTDSTYQIAKKGPMQIRLASIMVENQDNALRFYTSILGFVKNKDIPMGPTFRWLTVSAPEGAEGVELVLQPMAFPPAQAYQKALFAAGIPATSFLTDDINAEYSRLKTLG